MATGDRVAKYTVELPPDVAMNLRLLSIQINQPIKRLLPELVIEGLVIRQTKELKKGVK